MFRKMTFSLAVLFASLSSASAQSSALPPRVTKHQDTQIYLSEITSIGIETVAGTIRHRIVGNSTYQTARCGTPGTRCVGLPAPRPTVLIVDEGGGAARKSPLGVFAICRRVMESAKPTDRFVLRADFERSEYQQADATGSNQELRVTKVTSCFTYRSSSEVSQ